MKTLPAYITQPDTRCPECGEPCEIVGLDNAFDYPGTHCTYGLAGTHYPTGWGWPVSDCCEADIEDALTDERCEA